MGDNEEIKFNRISLSGGGPDEVGGFKIGKAGLVWSFKDKKVLLRALDTASAKWIHATKQHYQLQFHQKGGAVVSFDGFREPDYEALANFVVHAWGLEFSKEELATKGWHWGDVAVQDGVVRFMIGDQRAFDVPLGAISQSIHLKDDVQLIMSGTSDPHGVVPHLSELRFTFPENPNVPEDEQRVVNAKTFHDRVLIAGETAGAGGEDKIVAIGSSGKQDDPKVKLALPRGRFELEFYPKFFKLVGSQHPFRVNYESVARIYHLPHHNRSDEVLLILSLDPPIRRGNTVYNHIIMELPNSERLSVRPNLTEEQIAAFQGQLNREMAGKMDMLISRFFKVLTKKKITIPGGSFKSHSGSHPFVACSIGANTGNLYVLERSLFFIDKPAINIIYEDVDMVEFLRHSQVTSTRNFDLDVRLKAGKSVILGGRPKNNVTFSHIAREDRQGLIALFRQKDIRLKGLSDQTSNADGLDDDDDDDDNDDDGDAGERRPARPAPGGGGGGEDESGPDSDFASQSSSDEDLEYNSAASSDDDDDDDDGGSGADGGEPKKKKAKEGSSKGKEEADDDDD